MSNSPFAASFGVAVGPRGFRDGSSPPAFFNRENRGNCGKRKP
jgi:hypothetical protein